MRKNSIEIIGYNFDSGGITPGSSEGPHSLRNLNIAKEIESLGYKVLDQGDVMAPAGDSQKTDSNRNIIPAKIDFTDQEKKCLDYQKVYQAVSKVYAKTTVSLEQGHTPLLLGGDHSLSIGSISAVADYYKQKASQDIGVLWIDTHGDINTPEVSPSKRIFGMALAFLAGKIAGKFSSLFRYPPALKLENLAYIGCRDLDTYEKEFLKKNRVKVFTMKEINLHGIGPVVKSALETVTINTCGFVSSFDLDVCDPQVAPGTGTRIPGGLTYREAHLLTDLIYDSGKCLSREFVELNPKIDSAALTSQLALSLILSSLGKSLL